MHFERFTNKYKSPPQVMRPGAGPEAHKMKISIFKHKCGLNETHSTYSSVYSEVYIKTKIKQSINKININMQKMTRNAGCSACF